MTNILPVRPNQPAPGNTPPRSESSAPAPEIPVSRPTHTERHHTTAPEAKKPKNRMPSMRIIGMVALALIVLAAAAFFLTRTSSGPSIDGSKYQAVFFTNGQVYFGKLQTLNDKYMKLTDIYYLQAEATDNSKNPQETTTTPDVQLIKLGNEVHGPDDEMIINNDQILFFENLKKDGKVSTTIAKDQTKK